MTSIKDAPEGMLRAWADAGVISSARYVDEMERRRAIARAMGKTIADLPTRVVQAPPLDYEIEDDLSRELDISSLAILDFKRDDDDGPARPAPLPPAARIVLAIAAAIAVIALFMVLPWKG